MTTVQKIKKAVQHLPERGLCSFRSWFEEFDAGAWDRQFEQDVRSGKLDALATPSVACPAVAAPGYADPGSAEGCAEARALCQGESRRGVRLSSSPVRRPSSVVCRLSSAFTLVELMVVVAIISILLMLLIPNIRTMREKAWSSSCQNNLRQYGVAMNQYMADNSGYFIYPGAGGAGAGRGYAVDQQYVEGQLPGGVYGRNVQPGSAKEYWEGMISAYIPAEVTIQSLSAGNPSIRVCPAVMQQIKKDGNFFDPDSPNFKGFQTVTIGTEQQERADFEPVTSGGAGYDANNKLILSTAFTTYAINITPQVYRKNKKDIPENVIAFIDWNARDGWWANLYNTTAKFQFTSPDNSIVQDVTPKWTNAWWLTEVGFHHLGAGNVYGANYVAMDGHVGWVGSNAISATNFTTGL